MVYYFYHLTWQIKNAMNIFYSCLRNLCLSLRPGCSKRNLMLLWQHECTWVYSHRMVSEVDVRRYRQAFVTAVKKEFTNDEEVPKPWFIMSQCLDINFKIDDHWTAMPFVMLYYNILCLRVNWFVTVGQYIRSWMLSG